MGYAQPRNGCKQALRPRNGGFCEIPGDLGCQAKGEGRGLYRPAEIPPASRYRPPTTTATNANSRAWGLPVSP